MKNKKFIFVLTAMTSFLTVAYISLYRSPEEVDKSKLDEEAGFVSQENFGVSLSLATQQKKSNNESSSQNIDLASAEDMQYSSLFDDSIGMDAKNIQEKELMAFQERLRSKPYPIQAFFDQGNATYEEWILAYETEMCQCKTKSCMKNLENDYLNFNPPFSDNVQTDDAMKSMHKVIACVNAVSVN